MTHATTSPLDRLKPIAGRALEAALNRALALDPDTQSALRGLDACRIEIRIETPSLALEIAVHDAGLIVGPARTQTASREGGPDIAVRASLAGLLSQLPGLRDVLDESGRGGATPGRVRISGDAELARRLQRLAEGFNPDWDQPFAEVFGDILGHQLARAARGALRFGLTTAKTLARDAAEFVTEESRDVVSKAELAAFHDDVDSVRERADRLFARADRLQRKATQGSA